MPFTWSAKDPDEEFEYTHDWANRLLVETAPGVFTDVGDEIIDFTGPDPSKHPSLTIFAKEGEELGDVVIGDIVRIPGTSAIQYWVSGGTKKTRFEARVHTVQGRTYDESFVLPVKER